MRCGGVQRIIRVSLTNILVRGSLKKYLKEKILTDWGKTEDKFYEICV